MLIDFIGLRQRFDNAAREAIQLIVVACIKHHNGKFIATKTTAHVAAFHERFEPFSDTGQQPVSDGMAECIVYCFKSVEVDHHERAFAAPAFGFRHRFTQPFGHLQAVWESGERVITRHMVDLVGAAALCRYIRSHAAEPEERSAVIIAGRG